MRTVWIGTAAVLAVVTLGMTLAIQERAASRPIGSHAGVGAMSAKQGGVQTVEREGYSAVINERGMLAALKIGGRELMGAPFRFCADTKWNVERTERPDNDTLRVFLHAESGNGTGEVDYHFEPRRLTLTLLQKFRGFSTWEWTADDQLAAVENLQNKNVDAAETIHYRDHGEIQAAPVIGMERAQRMRLWLADGTRLLFWHSGWGAAFNIDEMGTFHDFTYRRNMLGSNDRMQVVFELERPAERPLRPGPAFSPFTDVFANLFLTGRTPQFQLKFTDATRARLNGAGRWAVNWTVRDFWNRVAAQGVTRFDGAPAAQTGDVRVPLTMKQRGWFDVTLSLLPDGPDKAAWAPSEFRTRFAVADPAPNLRSNELPPHRVSEYTYSALLGLGLIRQTFNMDQIFRERGQEDWPRLDQQIEPLVKAAGNNHINFLFQANSRPKWCTDAEYEQIAFDLVSRYKDRVRNWEVENEPNFHFSPRDYVQHALIPFATGAKRADPTCTVLGPACVNVPFTLSFLQAIREADALKLIDGVSTHTYMGPGESWEQYGNPLYLQQVRKLIGNKPIWQTEQGYRWDQSGRQQQACYVVRQFLQARGLGITNDHHYYFYPVQNGFEPWYLVQNGYRGGNEGTLEPSAVAVRVMNAQTGDRPAGAVEQPRLGVYQLRFSGRDADVVALWTLDFDLTVTLWGENATAVDFMGEPIPLDQTGGLIHLKLNGYPAYLHLPHGAPLTLVGPDYGVDYSHDVAAQASSFEKNQEPAKAFDGVWTPRDAIPGLPVRTAWESDVPDASPEHPVWLQADFAAPHRIDRALLLTPLPAVVAVPRDFVLQSSDDGQHWRNLAMEKDWVGWADMLTFPPVRTRHIRLTVTALNDGWHHDNRWLWMVRPDLKQFTNRKCQILDLMLFGPREGVAGKP